MMKIRVNDIKMATTRRMEDCADTLKKILISENYEEETVLLDSDLDSEYVTTIRAGEKCFNFKSFRTMKRVTKKCELLTDKGEDVICPEEYFDFEERMQISKAILAGIAEGTFIANKEFCMELWNWIFRLGMAEATDDYNYDDSDDTK